MIGCSAVVLDEKRQRLHETQREMYQNRRRTLTLQFQLVNLIKRLDQLANASVDAVEMPGGEGRGLSSLAKYCSRLKTLDLVMWLTTTTSLLHIRQRTLREKQFRLLADISRPGE